VQSRDALGAGGLVPTRPAASVLDALAAPGTEEELLARWYAHDRTDQLVHNHLLPIDGAAMAVGLEVRMPYLDRAVIEAANAIPLRVLAGPPPKAVLRHLAADVEPGLLDHAIGVTKVGLPAAGGRCLERFAALCAAVLPDDDVPTAEVAAITAPHRRFARRLFELLFVEGIDGHPVRSRSDAAVDVLEVLAAEAGRPISQVRRAAQM